MGWGGAGRGGAGGKRVESVYPNSGIDIFTLSKGKETSRDNL